MTFRHRPSRSLTGLHESHRISLLLRYEPRCTFQANVLPFTKEFVRLRDAVGIDGWMNVAGVLDGGLITISEQFYCVLWK